MTGSPTASPQGPHPRRSIRQWVGDGFPRFLVVEIQHPCPYYDDSCEENGPRIQYGDGGAAGSGQGERRTEAAADEVE